MRIPKELFECPNISIDCAIMEKTRKGLVIAFDTKWTDIGVGNLFGKNQIKIKMGIS